MFAPKPKVTAILLEASGRLQPAPPPLLLLPVLEAGIERVQELAVGSAVAPEALDVVPEEALGVVSLDAAIEPAEQA